jgi:hypothetical protein
MPRCNSTQRVFPAPHTCRSSSSDTVMRESGSSSSPGSRYLTATAHPVFSTSRNTNSEYFHVTGTLSRNVSPP